MKKLILSIAIIAALSSCKKETAAPDYSITVDCKNCTVTQDSGSKFFANTIKANVFGDARFTISVTEPQIVAVDVLGLKGQDKKKFVGYVTPGNNVILK